jgi:hypothetical protein
MFMRGRRSILPLILAFVPSAAPALDVTFAGVVVDTCTIALATPGVMVLSTDGTILGTDQGIGIPATVTVVSIGTNNISLATPELLTHPLDYTPGDETVEMAYSGLASHPLFSALPLDFDIGLVSLTSLFVDLKVTDAGGFTQGAYTARTVLTCS